MSYWLYLDDFRMPSVSFATTRDQRYLRNDWRVVRNYDEFVEMISKDGLPEMISFDHDLADEHYESPDTSAYTEKTGYDCAKWLIDYCLDNDRMLPGYLVHSMNGVGKENIEALLDNFLKNFSRI